MATAHMNGNLIWLSRSIKVAVAVFVEEQGCI
jgi:hypothetical protein